MTPGPKNNFLQLNDNGTLSLYPGKSGVATGAALKTIGSSENLQYLMLTSIQYNLAEPKIPKVDTLFGTSQKLTNSLPSGIANLTAHLSMTYADTQAYDWNTSETVTKEINSTTTIKFPVIATAVSLSLSKSTTIAEGKSTASGMETTYQSEVTIAVPAGVTYGVDIYATQQDALLISPTRGPIISPMACRFRAAVRVCWTASALGFSKLTPPASHPPASVARRRLKFPTNPLCPRRCPNRQA